MLGTAQTRRPALPAGALHVTNGDATVPGLRAAGLAGEILTWRDALHEGPVPALPDAGLRGVRARFLAGEAASDLGTAAELARRDGTLAAHRDGDYVLWFEADLYDGLQVVQILAALHALEVAPDRITLICVGEHPGIAHFGGLGELRPEQLQRLPATAATPLTAAALEHAERAWAALRAPEPLAINTIAGTPSRELRFVAEAYDRLAREFPSTRDGLSLTERRILAAVAAGASTAGEAFARAARKEARPFLGDTWCFDRIARLAGAAHPLLVCDPPARPVGRHARVGMTDAGRQVLEGRLDHVALNGIDRWIGGVRLTGDAAAWRFDEGSETIVAGRN